MATSTTALTAAGAAVPAAPPPQRSSGRGPRPGWVSALWRVGLVLAAILVIGLVWTLYKAMGHATGDTWPFTDIELPVATDDTTLPPFLDVVTRFFEPQRAGDDFPLWRFTLGALAFTFREAFVGFVVGAAIGLGLALLMLRTKWFERGVLPWIIISQTIPLIALAPVIVIWGNKIDVGFFEWQQWMSVSIIATYLTFFPVAVNGLRGLQSPTNASLDLMRSLAASRGATLRRLRFPAAVPYLIPAFKLAATASVVGAIVGEISAGVRGGIGRLIIDYSQQYLQDPPRLYCVVIMAALLGVLFVALIDVLDRVLMRNRPRESR